MIAERIKFLREIQLIGIITFSSFLEDVGSGMVISATILEVNFCEWF